MDFAKLTLDLLKGFAVSLEIFFLTLLIALPLGLIISFGSRSKIKFISAPIKFIIWIIRGTPLMLQIFVIYYAPFNFNQMPAVIIAFSINYAAYFSEIFRGGINAIPIGQYEAAKVLGLTKLQTFRKIVLPQLIKNIMAPMGNETITLVKDTALARVIAVTEIIHSSMTYVTFYGTISPLMYTAVFYLAFNGILTLLFAYIEKKLSYYR